MKDDVPEATKLILFIIWLIGCFVAGFVTFHFIYKFW